VNGSLCVLSSVWCRRIGVDQLDNEFYEIVMMMMMMMMMMMVVVAFSTC